VPYERLSAQDASFLHMETATAPMHVGSLALFEAAPFLDADGRFRIEDARRLIASRLDGVPRFRRRLMEVPFGQGHPVWVDDDRFDLAFHVRLTAVPRPGTDEQLTTLMARLQGRPLDRRRPLWELWFVEGVEGDRVAVVQKTHHALVDGMSAVDVASVLLDVEPRQPPAHVPVWRPEPAPSSTQLLGDSVAERLAHPAELARRAGDVLRRPGLAADTWQGVSRALRAAGTPAPRLPFNERVGPDRRFELARAGLDTARGIKADAGCTVNDVVLAVVAGGLRHHLTARGVPVDGLVVRTMVPVSVRDDAAGMTLGNRVSAMVAELPVGIADPVQRLRLVSEQMRSVKDSGQAVGAEALASLLDYAPPTLLSLAGRLMTRQRAVNLVVTNVPGPQFPLYCMGARMLEAFPYVGLTETIGLVVAVLSYDGQLGFGVTGDADLLPDLAVLAEGIEKSFAELAEAHGR
jgi:diacylglycerol O-acyltransferase